MFSVIGGKIGECGMAKFTIEHDYPTSRVFSDLFHFVISKVQSNGVFRFFLITLIILEYSSQTFSSLIKRNFSKTTPEIRYFSLRTSRM